MNDEGDKYCLLQAREQNIDIAATARVTTEFFNAPLPEIAMALRKGRGFLASGLPKVVGAEMQRRLDAIGVETVLLPASALAPLPHPAAVKEMELLPAALSAGERKEGPRSEIPYMHILFLSVCEILRPERRAEGDPDASRNILDTIHKFNPLKAFHESVERRAFPPKARHDVFLSIFTRKPHEYFKISRAEICFRGLGEAKSPTARENFRAVVDSLIRRAPTAYVTIYTHRFMAGAEPEAVAFPDMAEVNRYHAWLLNVLGSR
jgi:hypothetical protein